MLDQNGFYQHHDYYFPVTCISVCSHWRCIKPSNDSNYKPTSVSLLLAVNSQCVQQLCWNALNKKNLPKPELPEMARLLKARWGTEMWRISSNHINQSRLCTMWSHYTTGSCQKDDQRLKWFQPGHKHTRIVLSIQQNQKNFELTVLVVFVVRKDISNMPTSITQT